MEDLEVLQVCVFGVDIEFDSRHWHIEVNTIEDLAQGRTAKETVSRMKQYTINRAMKKIKLTQYRIVLPL